MRFEYRFAMNKKLLIILSTFVFVGSSLFAQTPPEENPNPSSIKAEEISLFSPSSYSGDVNINQAGSIAQLAGVRKSILKKQKGFEGYRIRIFAKTGAGARSEADDIKVNFREKFDEVTPYLHYNSPNWEIHVGNFRTRMEAMEMMEEIKDDYPQAFIVKAIIEFPELEDN